MHSRLLAVLPIFFMDRLFYAALTHLLNAQLLARCPALSSLWTGSSMLSLLTLLNAQPLARCPALSSLWTGSSMLS
jgi:hypothetical protein